MQKKLHLYKRSALQSFSHYKTTLSSVLTVFYNYLLIIYFTMSLLVICIYVTVLGFAAAQFCRTPDEKNGLCVDIEQCEYFKSNRFSGGLVDLESYQTCPFSKVI